MPVQKMNKFGVKNYLYFFPWFLMLFEAMFSIHKPLLDAGPVEQDVYLKYFNIFMYSVSLMLLFLNFKTILSILKGRWLYIYFMVYITASAFWSADPSSTLRISAYFWVIAVVCLMAGVAFKNNPEKFFQTLIFYSIVMLGGSLITIFLNPGRGIGEDGRWLGLTAHANGLGIVSIISVWANISYFSITKSAFVKLFNIFMIFLSAVCIYGANSATSLVVSVAIVLLTSTLRSFNTNRLTKLFAQITGAIFFIILSISILYLVMPEIFNIEAMFRMVGRESTFTGRTVLWQMAMAKIYQHPIIGSGFQEFIRVQNGMQITHFHNGYIELLIRGGTIALMFVVAFVFQLVVSLKRFSDPKLYIYFLIMILAILAHNVTEGSFGRGVNALWLIFSFIYFYTDRKRSLIQSRRAQIASGSLV